MKLVITYANKHNMVDEHSAMRTSSDVPVVRLEDLIRWLRERQDSMEDNGLHVCVDTLLHEVEP